MPLAAFPKCFLRALVTDRTMTVEQWIELAARELPIDGVEFYWGFTPAEPAQRAVLRSLLARHRLTAPMMCYSPDFIQVDPQKRAAEVAAQIRAIEVTAELGGRYCRTLSGQWKPDVERTDGLAMAADSIAACLDAAARAGVCVVLENHYKDGFWNYPEFAQRQDDFLELLDRIPRSPVFGVNYDPSNALIAGDDPLGLLIAVKDRVVTMHASDRYFAGGTVADLRRSDRDSRQGYAPVLRHGVVGRGSLDYDALFAVLRSVRFDGWISIEDGEDPAVGLQHLRESAEFLRRKMTEYDLT